MFEYETYFVERGRYPQKFAAKLKDVLNTLTQKGWQVLRTEYDAKGMLVLAVRLLAKKAPSKKERYVPHSQDVQSEDYFDIPHEALDFLSLILDRIGPIDAEDIRERTATVTSSIAKRYSSEQLRSFSTAVKSFRKQHIAQDHPSDSCPLVSVLDAMIETLDKVLRRSLS